MAAEALAEAARCHAQFHTLLEALAMEHQRLWVQTQQIAINKEGGLSDQATAAMLENVDLPGFAYRGSDVGNFTFFDARFESPIVRPGSPPPESVGPNEDDEIMGAPAERNESQDSLEEAWSAGGTQDISTSSKKLRQTCTIKMPSEASDSHDLREHAAAIGSMKAEHNAFLYDINIATLYRLQARLGVRDGSEQITARHLYNTLKSLGVDRFTEHQIDKLTLRMSRVSTSVVCPEGDRFSKEREEFQSSKPKSLSFLRRGVSQLSDTLSTGSSFGANEKRIPFKTLLHFMVSEEAERLLGPDMEGTLHTVKEVLVSGDANRLVAELTSVRVDDLAAPPPYIDWESIMEPIVGSLIVLNGVVIGLQTDPDIEAWRGWMWVEACFTTAFVLEIILRLSMVGLREFFTGNDCYWGWFDSMIVVTAIADTLMDLFFTSLDFETATFTVIRTIRLTRITRLFRIFRLGWVRELNIMIKGLFSGFQTLFWAFVLLFLTIYVLAVFATYTLKKGNEEVEKEQLFSTLPRSMLTCYRCFIGDCTTTTGAPIVKLMADAKGFPFIAAYLVSYSIVTFGLFNLIVALYVEITMAAARRSQESDKKRRERESLRVAHITKKLLKKFCIAQHVDFGPMLSASVKDLSKTLRSTKNLDVNDDMTISKEFFLLIIQDPEVQRLMNDLDIPPDRANLFDVLDADGTGDLHVTELVHGLLKVRGEARKSDVVAALLGVRSIQESLREFQQRVFSNQEDMMRHLGLVVQSTSKKSMWDRISNASSRHMA